MHRRSLVAVVALVAAAVDLSLRLWSSGPPFVGGDVGRPRPPDAALSVPGQKVLEPGGRPAKLEAAFGKLPLSFEANRGQLDARVRFMARGPGYSPATGTPPAAASRSTPPGARTSQDNMDRGPRC